MNHSGAYKTCGIAQLLQALLQIFFVLDVNTPTWVKILIIGTSFVIAVALMTITGGENTKVSLLKILIYIYIITISMGIGGLMFVDTIPEDSIIPPADFPSLVRTLFLIGCICLPIFAIFAEVFLLLLFRIKNNLGAFLAPLSVICFGVIYYVPTLPHNLISVPFVFSGVAFLTINSKVR